MKNYRFMRFPGGRLYAFTMSYDDGVGTDIRLMEIMRKNGLKGTFNLNSAWGPVENPDYVGDYSNHPTCRLSLAQMVEHYRDFEVATHGVTHGFYGDLPTEAALYDFVKDREILEKAFGRIIRGHAYPNGGYTEEVKKAFAMAGAIYGRTAKRGSGQFEIPEDWMEYTATAHHNDDLDSLYDRFFAPASYYTSPRLFCLWGHSYEFENQGNWDKIERFAEKIGGHDEVFYGGMQEIVEYTLAYRSLVHSMDSHLIYNPTSRDVWIDSGVHKKDVICIHAGETVRVESK